MEIIPNPFGGVNTHLLEHKTYIIGIVPQAKPFYTASQAARRPKNPEAEWRCQRKSKIKKDAFSKEYGRHWRWGSRI
jgi:hypothetical protein